MKVIPGLLFFFSVSMLPATLSAADALDTVKIEQVTGLKGALNEKEGVFKVSAPRSDVKVSVDQSAMPPFMGLTSWAAFKADPKGGVMVMGDHAGRSPARPSALPHLDNGIICMLSQSAITFRHLWTTNFSSTIATAPTRRAR